MNFRTTLILIALLAGAVIFLVVDRMTSKPASEAKTESTEAAQGQKVVDMDSSAVTKVVIAPTGGGAKTVLEKKDGKWRLTEPVDAAADQFSADELVRGLTDLRSSGDVEKGVAGEPKFDVEVTGAGGKTVKLAFSDKSVVGDTMYVTPDGASKALVVPSDVYDKLDKTDDLRDKQLVSASSQDIKQLKYRTPTTQVSLVKNGNDWEVTEPEKMPADQSAVSDLLFGVTGMRAVEFEKGDDKTALAHPQLTISYSTTQPSTQPATTQPAFTTIVVGRYQDIRKQNVLAGVEGSNAVATVPATVLTTFAKSPLDLRDKKVLDIDPASVTQVTLSSDKSGSGKTPLVMASGPTAEKREVTLMLRSKTDAKTPANPEPASKPTATSKPTTMPSTTQATTKPVAPPSKWVAKEQGGYVSADDAKVSTLLSDLHPLRAEKFLEKSATTRPAAQYAITVKTGAVKGTPVVTHEITLVDPGEGKPLVATYNGLTFEVARTLATHIDEDFVTDKKTPVPANLAPPVSAAPAR